LSTFQECLDSKRQKNRLRIAKLFENHLQKKLRKLNKYIERKDYFLKRYLNFEAYLNPFGSSLSFLEKFSL